jgi:cell division protein FtsN
MAKDYAKSTFNLTRTRKKNRSRRVLFFFIFSFLLLNICFFSGWYIYQQGMITFNKENAMTWVDQFKTLLHRHKSQVAIHQNTKTDTASTVNQDSPVRFDFYTELPNMQVTAPIIQNETNKNVVRETPKELEPSSSKSSVQGSPEEVVEVSQNKSDLSSKNAKTHLDLGKEDLNTTSAHVASENHSKAADHAAAEIQYVVQVGAYKNDSTASEMRISMLLAGFDVKVVKTSIGDHIIYRIQQGPFSSLSRAKLAQKKLQTKGYDGVVQKIN